MQKYKKKLRNGHGMLFKTFWYLTCDNLFLSSEWVREREGEWDMKCGLNVMSVSFAVDANKKKYKFIM